MALTLIINFASIVGALKDGCIESLESSGAQVRSIVVPGAFELPLAAKHCLSTQKKIDAVVCIGCLIKGETDHYDYISKSVSQALMQVGLDTGKPVIFGVLTCTTESQALQRAGLQAGHHNHGPEWGQAAIEMARLTDTRPQTRQRFLF